VIISGTGITTFQARIKTDFRVQTELAIRWFQCSSGKWLFTDRGATVDTYETEVRVQGIRGRVEELVTQLNANRTAGSNQVTLSGFDSNELIFGADVVYTSITATLLNTPKVKQNRWKSFETDLTLRAIGPTLTGTATFPALKYLDVGFDGNVDRYQINKIDSYSGVYSYLDMQSDIGIFKGRFQFTGTEMRNLRKWHRTNRGTTYALTGINGVVYPFGVLRGAFPKNVKLLAIEQEEMRDLDNWYATLKLGEVI
jgi:hypothetical protein